MRNSKLTISISKTLSFGARTSLLAVGVTAISLGANSAYAGLVHGGGWANIGGTDGIVYASEIFGPGYNYGLPVIDVTNVPPTPAIQPTVIFTPNKLNTVFPKQFRVIFELDNNATFVDMPATVNGKTATDALVVTATGSVVTETVSVTEGPVAGGEKTRGGTGFNRAKFDVGLDPAVDPAVLGSVGIFITSLALKYQIRAAALASPGQKITMTMKITDIGELETYAMIEETLVLANSAEGTTASVGPFVGISSSGYRVAVGSGNLEFDGTDSVDEAKIGVLTVKSNDGVFCPNAVDEWVIGKDCALLGTGNTDEGEQSTLTITGGQFAASVNAPGYVDVGGYQQKADDEETIYFKLTDEMVSTIETTGADSTTELPVNSAFITIVADGKTEINVPENAPSAELLISYRDSTFQQTSVSAVELSRIRRDGTVCTLYNVSPSDGSDDVSIRITNMSAVDGEVYGALYDKDANEIFPSTLLTNKDGVSIIKPKATLALFAPDLEKIAKWSGRGILVLTTTLPDIDVLGLLRDKSSAAAPLTNLSTGVTGKSCVK